MPGAEERDESVIHIPGVAPVDAIRKLGLCISYICVSASLIRFNKFLMTKERFPYSMFLTSCHMTVSLLLCSLLYFFKPAVFPGVASCEGKKLLVLKWMMPIGIAFAISLFTSNQAYIYCSVSFLQFMKEGNVILCFLMSCAVGLQVLTRIRCAVIIWILVGSSLAVNGEMNFVAVGFIFQLVSQCAECIRAVIGEMVLGGGALRLDALSYTFFVAPTCLLVLFAGNAVTWDPNIPHALAQWWPYVLPNALIAFVLNILVASVIKEISAVGFMLCGICKDIVIVLFSCVAFGEVVTPAQIIGFMVTLGGVSVWSYLKVCPGSSMQKFVETLLAQPSDLGATEQTVLIQPANKV